MKGGLRNSQKQLPKRAGPLIQDPVCPIDMRVLSQPRGYTLDEMGTYAYLPEDRKASNNRVMVYIVDTGCDSQSEVSFPGLSYGKSS
jgi:hypothetical protein